MVSGGSMSHSLPLEPANWFGHLKGRIDFGRKVCMNLGPGSKRSKIRGAESGERGLKTRALEPPKFQNPSIGACRFSLQGKSS